MKEILLYKFSPNRPGRFGLVVEMSGKITTTECDKYLFLTEYKYQIFFGLKKSPNIEYYSALRKFEYRIPNTIWYQENLYTEYK